MDTSIRHRLIDFTLKGALIGVFSLLASAGSNASSTSSTAAQPDLQKLAPDEAYVMVKINHRSHSSLKSSSFKLAGSNQLQLTINKDTDMQLIKVKAGIYKPQLTKMHRAKGIVIEPGTVTSVSYTHLRAHET